MGQYSVTLKIKLRVINHFNNHFRLIIITFSIILEYIIFFFLVILYICKVFVAITLQRDKKYKTNKKDQCFKYFVISIAT